MCVGININQFHNLYNLTKNYLRQTCPMEIRQIFGGSYKYELSRVKLFGFNTTNEYKTDLAIRNGFKTRWDMEWVGIQKNQGFKTKHEYYTAKAKARGFKDYAEYQRFKRLKKKK